MAQFTGLIGIFLIFALAFMLSNNRRMVNWRLVICGLSLQLFLAMFILRTPWGQSLFEFLGRAVEKVLSFANAGAIFVLGPLADSDVMVSIFGPAGSFIFAFKLVPTLIFIASLAALAYHLGLMQKIVNAFSWAIYRIMGASGSEATSNAASVLVGQVEAQILIKPYMPTVTNSELLAIMAGSMACISGAIMAVYIQMGVSASYMMAASVMAIPGALVISKIVYPETEPSPTRGEIQLEVEQTSVNSIDALAKGAADGLNIGVIVCGLLIAAMAAITLIDYILGKVGLLLVTTFFDSAKDVVFLHIDLNNLSLGGILGGFFRYAALAMGVPANEATIVGGLMGTKMVINEFVAYSQMTALTGSEILSPKSNIIATFALCGFANFMSVAMLIGGLGELAPERKQDLARLGIRAMVVGTMASYLSASLAGMLFSEPAGASSASLLLPLTVMAGCTAVILIFFWATNNPEKAPEYIAKLTRAKI
ncbi:MAG: CNT family concentrative nucleoside transporter [Halioglobus sp.]|jgi:CNT family concentrative nucleoside transporter